MYTYMRHIYETYIQVFKTRIKVLMSSSEIVLPTAAWTTGACNTLLCVGVIPYQVGVTTCAISSTLALPATDLPPEGDTDDPANSSMRSVAFDLDVADASAADILE
jgi:hypothetical protein